jgi:hypothetical protein
LLQIGIKDGNYLALLYGLPIAALHLVDENRHERAVEIYALVESHPTIGNSRWWRDAVGHDADLTPSKNIDLFRIKIWDIATDTVIYDNQMGGAEDADPTTGLEGGSIVIH